MIFLFLVCIYFIGVMIILVGALCIYGWLLSSAPYTGPVSDHFDGKKFFSLGMSLAEKTAHAARQYGATVKESVGGDPEGNEERSVLRWILRRKENTWKYRPLKSTGPSGAQKTRSVERVWGSELRVTFVNHSTVLIQTEGKNILTDPIWSKRASPVQWAGPARFAPPGIAFEALPPIDMVLLSHNHYDHLDLHTLHRLVSTHSPRIYTHLGTAAYLQTQGILGAIDMDWGDVQKVSGSDGSLEIHSVPAQHFSSRGLADRNRSLWGGFVIRGSHGAGAGDIYFAGDSGSGPWVDRIATEYPDGFRFAFIPIGAYQPAWMMSEVHMSPDEAVEVYKKLKVKRAMAIHFGTFMLADDGQDQPVERLRELTKADTSIHFEGYENGTELSTGI